MAIISAFADEIDQDPDVQIEVLKANDIRHVELRGAWGTNVMKFDRAQCSALKKRFDEAGLAVSCIASPIGKIRLDEDLDQHFEDFKHAVELSDYFGCRRVRIFSFYPPQGQDIADHRQTVIDQLKRMYDYVEGRDVVLLLENETRIYGDTPARCLDLMETLKPDQRRLVMAFDPANFVAVDALPVYQSCWKPLARYVGYFHMKDRQAGPTAPCVPCGQGVGDVEMILRDVADWPTSGQIILALEPHLKTAGQFAGSTGPELFKVAADALRQVCQSAGLAC